MKLFAVEWRNEIEDLIRDTLREHHRSVNRPLGAPVQRAGRGERDSNSYSNKTPGDGTRPSQHAPRDPSDSLLGHCCAYRVCGLQGARGRNIWSSIFDFYQRKNRPVLTSYGPIRSAAKQTGLLTPPTASPPSHKAPPPPASLFSRASHPVCARSESIPAPIAKAHPSWSAWECPSQISPP